MQASLYQYGKQFSSESWAEVERLIREDLSPEQAANRLKLEGELLIGNGVRIAHEYNIGVFRSDVSSTSQYGWL
ncbi:hypothetical protein [Candidatus Nitrotoga sp. AM1P]|uniref:hypothetical protein n=1 Tax=Candidatus Nitrotoga sp. AM1P TaxID=2559597 RepID=UPI0010B93B26|nr:hypothetical protein [Candidatus Nitrotoga sp. AM1P]BBJ24733.1 hypothetical protein W01_26600 [Candidatus Nitrotoga sp. AM1P]